jgi:hypothetical protein
MSSVRCWPSESKVSEAGFVMTALVDDDGLEWVERFSM